MGWWKIDPASGKPLEESYSELSAPPDLLLLNAVPGVDNEIDAHYLGDAPWDYAGSLVEDLRKVLGTWPELSHSAALKLVSTGALPKSVEIKATAAKRLKTGAKRFWNEIDELYQDEWGRKATDAEKHWIREFAVNELSEPPASFRLEAKTKRGSPLVLSLVRQKGVVTLEIYQPSIKSAATIEIPVEDLAEQLDEPTFKLTGQMQKPDGPAIRVLESSTRGAQRRLKVMGPMGGGLEAVLPEKNFHRALQMICGIR